MKLNFTSIDQLSFRVLIVYFCFYGVIKFLFTGIFPYSNYFPNLFLFSFLLFLIFKNRSKKIFSIILFMLIFILMQAAVAIYNGIGINLIILGVWALVPFFMGMLIWKEFYNDKHTNFCLFIFIVSILGLIADIYFDLPWSELSVIGLYGENVTYTRDSLFIGISRNAGFSGNFWNSSSVVAVTALYLISNKTISKTVKFIVYMLLIFSLFLAFNKSLIAAFILLIFLRILFRSFRKLIIGISSYILLFFGVFAPYFSGYLKAFSEEIAYSFEYLITLNTRVDYFWPFMISLIEERGNFLFGIGIGSFGFASTRFESIFSASGDNVYLYTIANFGIIGLIILNFYLIVGIYKFTIKKNTDFFLYSIFIIVFYGIMVNIFEVGLIGLLLGAVISASSVNKIHEHSNSFNLNNNEQYEK